MNMDAMNTLVSRVCFFGGFALLAYVILQELLTLAGFGILQVAYTPGTLLTTAIGLFVIVIALLLRQIREELKQRGN